MKHAAEILTKNRIPTNSFLKAVHFCSVKDFSMDEQIAILKELVPSANLSELDPIPLKYTFLYVVQDTVKLMELDMRDRPADLLGVFEQAVKKTEALLVKNPWIYTKEFEAEYEAAKRPLLKAEKNQLILNKGTKLEAAMKLYMENKTLSVKELAQLFVKELGMSPAGATTYVYSAKKKVESRERTAAA